MAAYNGGNNNSYAGGRGSSYGGGRGYGGRQGGGSPAPTKPHTPLDGKKYVDTAQQVINALKGNRGGLLTTSKIRNLLSMISTLYDEVRRERAEKLSDEEQSRIQYIRLHFAYEAGRDNKVKDFVNEADIFAHIRDIGDSKEKFLLFCKYMEALVAFHRFYGGKE